ncbi:MAG: hypothetical protein QM664_01835 [Flavihumibacter sp.]
MKKSLLFIAVVLLAVGGFTQSAKYSEAMKAQIAKLATAHTDNSYPALANSFERIGDAEKNQWLPYYYAAYSAVMTAFTEKDKSKVDAMADRAESLLGKAESLAGAPNSELYIIKSMIASAHLQVDPQNRWQQMGRCRQIILKRQSRLIPPTRGRFTWKGSRSFLPPKLSAAESGGKADI